jgi:sulfite exporter TauE/SafE
MHTLGRVLSTGIRFDRAPRVSGKLIGGFTRRIRRGSVLGEYLLGAALELLPCGFLYAAIAAADASGRPGMGAAAMLAFGPGTRPVLMVVGISGNAAGRPWNRGVAIAAPVVMALNTMLLLALAWQRIT